MARCLLLESNLPKKLRPYAIMTAAYIRNRCYNPRVGKTPFEAYSAQKPNISGMHVFGSICLAYVQNKKKLDARSERGYDKESSAYLVYFPEKDIVRKVWYVRFTGLVKKGQYESEDETGLSERCEPNMLQSGENVNEEETRNKEIVEVGENVEVKVGNSRYRQRERESSQGI